MKHSIQALTKCSNPLGKSLDFVSEDIDSMSKEYEKWRKQCMNSQTQMEEQLRITEDTIMPLQDKLALLEEQIRDKSSKIHNIKSQLIKNQSTIENLLYSVVANK